jgi:hypothetical protein
MFWLLPGPQRFVETVASLARQGNSVLLQLPEFGMPRLTAALRDKLHAYYTWESCVVNDSKLPAEFLFERFVPDSEPGLLRNASSLATQPRFQGRSIWVEGLTLHATESWCPFLKDYAHVSRNHSELQRTVLLVPLVGEAASRSVSSDAGLVTVTWDGQLHPLDLRLYAATLVDDLNGGLRSEMQAALIGELSGWDADLAEYLSRFDLDRLLAPERLLCELANQRGWASDALRAKNWWAGGSYHFNGNTLQHPALIALDAPEELLKLVWRAELGVLFPFIEEQRQLLLRKYESLLFVPFVTNRGEAIQRKQDLEIGHLECQIGRHPAVSRHDSGLMADLREARNALSHLESVPQAIVLRLCAETASRS